MTEKQYSFKNTRFNCGCAYRTMSEDLVFCPEHRHSSPVGFITGKETTQSPGPEVPQIPGLVMDPYIKGRPKTMMNTSANSLHTRTYVLDGQGEEWSDYEDEIGSCNACFIDSGKLNPTQIAMCECGKEECSYRWCGIINGLHALWRIHAQGLSQQTTGIPEDDIFSYGKYDEQTQELKEILKAEKQELEKNRDRLVLATLEARQEAGTGKERQSDQHQVYLSQWLDSEYAAITKEQNSTEDVNYAQRRLATKLLRLHIIGATPAV